MNNDAAKNANNQLITVQNEATPDAAFFAAAVASAIAPEANFLSPGLKMETVIFWKVT